MECKNCGKEIHKEEVTGHGPGLFVYLHVHSNIQHCQTIVIPNDHENDRAEPKE